MNVNWSDWLIDLPVLWDMGLRVTVVLGLAWVLHHVLIRSNPRWRIQLWRFTSVAVVAVSLAALLPKFSFSVVAKPAADDYDVPVSQPSLPLGTSVAATPFAAELDDPPTDEPWDAILASVKAVSAPAPVAIQSQEPRQTFSSWLTGHWRLIMAGCWGAGASLLTVRWLTAQFRIRRLLSRAAAAPAHCRRLSRRTADRLNVCREFELRVSSDTDVPFVVGLRRPVIVLPKRMAAPSYAHELPAIFAHELTHIKSHDLVWMGATHWIAIPLWFHPLTWRVRTAHSMACEEVADAVAADNVGDIASYSGTLARVALAAVAHPPAAAAMSMARSPEIMSRLARLKQGLASSPLTRRRVVLTTFVGLLALIPLASIKFAYAELQAAAARVDESSESGRVLNFPEDRAVGMVHIALEKESEWWDTYFKAFDYRRDWAWKYHAQAKGNVTVPAGAKVKLTLEPAGVQDMTWVSGLKPDDLYELSVWHQEASSHTFQFGDAQMRHLARLTGLTELTLYNVQATDGGLSSLEPLQSLEKLMIDSPLLQGDGLKSIGKLTSLEVLNIGGMELPDESLAHLSNLNSLEEIYLPKVNRPGAGFDSVMRLPKLRYIRGLDFADAHLARFKKCETLTALDLKSCSRITNASLAKLAQVPTLEYINFAFTNITDAGIVRLKPLRSLRRLELSSVNPPPSGPAFSDTAAAVLSELPMLEHLSLPQIGGVNQAIAHLSKLQNLRHLMIAGGHDTGYLNDAGIRQLAKCRNLESVVLNAAHLSDAAGDSLAELTNLKRFTLASRGMGDDGIAKLKALKNLEHLQLIDNSHVQDETRGSGFTLAGISRLGSLPNLKVLSVYTQGTLDADADALDFSMFPALENFTTIGLRDKDMRSLANCRNLTWLQIGTDNPQISDTGLAHLASQRSLDRLTIGGDGISDEGLVHLAGMEKLNSLNVKGDITDRGLRHIEQLKSLETLFIASREALSPGALEQLQASLPSLRNLVINGDRAGGKTVANSPIVPLQVGQVAPPFELTALDGKVMNVADQRGKVVLLYFWSTYCAPCVASMPKLKEVHEVLSKYDDFAMISMSGDVDDPTLRRFVRKQRLAWPQVRIGPDSKIAASYGVVGFPDYVLIGRDGKVLHVGGDGLDDALRAALDIQSDKAG